MNFVKSSKIVIILTKLLNLYKMAKIISSLSALSINRKLMLSCPYPKVFADRYYLFQQVAESKLLLIIVLQQLYYLVPDASCLKFDNYLKIFVF